MRITFAADINIFCFAQWDREHIIQIDHGVVFDFQKVQSFLHFCMLFFEGGQWCKIMKTIDFKNDTDIFTIIFLVWFSV